MAVFLLNISLRKNFLFQEKHMNVAKKIINLLLCLGLISMVASCDQNDEASDTNEESESSDEESQTYTVTLTALNSDLAGEVEGEGTFIIDQNDFTAEIQVDNAPADIVHLQHITTGEACPTDADDINDDGIIDVVEGVAQYGPIIVPLDGDLLTQAGGIEWYPTADQAGSYFYSQTANLEDMLNDLRAEDENPDDPIVKLGEGEELDLEGKHVIIHGVPESVELPDTAASVLGLPANATLPIACGIIEREDSGDNGDNGDNGDDGDNGDNGDNGDDGDNGDNGDDEAGDEQQQDQNQQQTQDQ